MSAHLSFTCENEKVVAFIHDDKVSSPHRADMDTKAAKALLKSLKNAISLAEIHSHVPAMREAYAESQKRSQK